jgi:hypothetical protein
VSLIFFMTGANLQPMRWNAGGLIILAVFRLPKSKNCLVVK